MKKNAHKGIKKNIYYHINWNDLQEELFSN